MKSRSARAYSSLRPQLMLPGISTRSSSPTVSCPPAVPIAVSGEIITEEAVLLFEKHKIYEIEVVKND